MGRGRKLGVSYKTHLWPEGYRECVECNNILPFSMFHKHSACYGGVNTVCKSCRKPLTKQQWKNKDYKLKMYSRCKSRAVVKNIEFNLDLEDIVIPDKCPVLNVPFDTSNDYCPSIDRVDSTKGYVKGNIQVISNKANRMKSNATTEELHMFAEWVKAGVCEI
jgi:hypothetical protein